MRTVIWFILIWVAVSILATLAWTGAVYFYKAMTWVIIKYRKDEK